MSRPLRLTQVVVTDVFAGTERYVCEVSTELAARGHDVTVVGGKPEPMLASVGDARWVPGPDTASSARALRAGGRRDVVHTHMTKADFVGAAAFPVTRAKQVSTRHITAPRGWSPAARRLSPVVRRRLARELAVSAWTSAQLERPADLVLLNGVRPVPDVDSAGREPVVLVAQRLAPEKDTATAVRAFATSGLAGRGWRLAVAGSGESRAALEALVAELDVTAAVDFLGWVDDTPALYRRAGILLAPAPTEPCGLTVIEAMAHGLPVVAAGAAGHLETVGTAVHTALFPPGDHAAAAAHLVRLADDAVAREAYGQELCTLQRSDFTLVGHVDRLEALYASLAGARGRG